MIGFYRLNIVELYLAFDVNSLLRMSTILYAN